MLEELKQKVYEANMLLPKLNLVTFTWGNVSGIDREKGLFVIKPSGVDYNKMKPKDMVVVDLDGKKIEGDFNPSSDTETHRILYNSFVNINGIVHTHSPWATIFAQAGQDIPTYGTTQADYFYGTIPCTRDMVLSEIQNNYEYNTGAVIIERFKNLDPNDIPAVLVKNHGPFCWGINPFNAVCNAAILEKIAMMAFYTQILTHSCEPMPQILLNKHFQRKHGPNAYYGQK